MVSIGIKTPEEIKIMAEGGKILATIIKDLEKKVEPGITPKELDRAAEALIFQFGGRCSFKGYQNFPACLCVSVNEEIVHGVPSNLPLQEGDIVSLDLGIFYKGFHNDMAVTLPVGRPGLVSKEALRLIQITKESLEKGIGKVKPGNTFGDVGSAIQGYVESRGFNVVRELCGHGIGREVHEDPQILNYGEIHTGSEIKEGMVFCIEPMVTAGHWKLKKSKDGFGYETEDGSLSAHFEHTVAVTKKGYLVLTRV